MRIKTTVPLARFRLVLIAALALLLVATSGWAQSAPDFTLKSVQDGKNYSLSQYRGKVVDRKSVV